MTGNWLNLKIVSLFTRLSPLSLITTLVLSAVPLQPVLAQQQDPHQNSQQSSSIHKLQSDHMQLFPVLQKYCLQCHKTPGETGFALSQLESKQSLRSQYGLWRRVLKRVRSGEMPPPEDIESSSPQNKVLALPDPLSKRFVKTLSASLKRERQWLKTDPGRVTMRRLNRTEYNYLIQDLFGVSFKAGQRFPDDDVGYGFDTVGDVLSVSPLLFERTLEAAEKVTKIAFRDLRTQKQRYQSEAMTMKGRGLQKGPFSFLWTNGEFQQKVKLSLSGRYKIRFHAYGLQAGKERVRAELKLIRNKQSKRIKAFRVKAVEKKPRTYEVVANLKSGLQTISVAFINDYFNALALKKSDRDRNFALDWVEIEGPIDQPELTKIESQFAQINLANPAHKNKPESVRIFLQAFMPRVFRRAINKADIDKAMKVFNAGSKDGFAAGVRLCLQYLLTSPHFLFHVELPMQASGQTASNIVELDDFQLANRLAFFLWCSGPDDELLKLAQTGQLRSQFQQQVNRMLDNPKSSRFMRAFVQQWLQIRQLPQFQPDPERFAGFDTQLKRDLQIETELFFESLIRENRGVLDLLNANYTYLNKRLAKHYGVSGVFEDHFQRTLVSSQRAGILGHGSILAVTSNPTRTSPVKRGKWILEVLLNDPPPPPLPGSDSLPPLSKKQRKKLSLRQQFEQHRSRAECAVCHNKLDPLGFALEHFDSVGRWRLEADGHKVDANAVLPNGSQFNGLHGLRKVLAAQPERLVQSLGQHLLIFALGRGPTDSDQWHLEKLAQELKTSNYSIKELILRICQLDAFRKRRIPKPQKRSQPDNSAKRAPEMEHHNDK